MFTGRKNIFEKFAVKSTEISGSSASFIISCVFVLVWMITGPVFKFSDTWQLIINTVTSIVTFLMVFLIQKTQNKDALAIQLKLNELLASNERASNRMISVEDLTEEELKLLHKFYLNLALLAKQEGDVYKSHSVETAIQLHKEKKKIHEKEFVEEVVDPQLKEMAEAEKQIRKRKRRSGAEV